MKPHYTDEDIIRFLYDEMNQAESEAFLTALCADERLWDRFEHFQEVVEKTSGQLYEPSEKSVNKIREYVAQTNPVQEEELLVSSPYVKGLKQQKLSINAILMAILILFGAITVSFSIYKVYQERQLQEHTKNLEFENGEVEQYRNPSEGQRQ